MHFTALLMLLAPGLGPQSAQRASLAAAPASLGSRGSRGSDASEVSEVGTKAPTGVTGGMGVMGVMGPLTAAEVDQEDRFASMPLGKEGYTTLGVGREEGGGGLPICRLITGMWQVAGGHGFTSVPELALAGMAQHADAGFTSFDLADAYGPAEEYVGRLCRGPLSSPVSQDCQFLTKWMPAPGRVTRRNAGDAVGRSLRRMGAERIDLLQLHWSEYEDLQLYDAVDALMHLQQQGQVLNLGLTNFDTAHLVDLLEQGAPIVSNQVSFSVLDTRPLAHMASACAAHNVKLLCYGTLLGGFLSSLWLGQREPSVGDDASRYMTASLRKYLKWIQIWGGWALFQELLVVLNTIAQKHHVSLSNVAQRWVLEQASVGGIVVGARLGHREHVTDNSKVFTFRLDEEDRQAIQAVQGRKRNDLMSVYGDCGGEYRPKTY